MQRAIGRARQRLQGEHPRRPKSTIGLLVEISCDLLLAAAAAAVLGGVALVVWAILDGWNPARMVAGLCLLAMGPVILLIWERIAWAPFVEHLSDLS